MYYTRLFKYPWDKRQIEVVFRCTREECQSLFIGYYEGTNTGGQANPEPFALQRCAPITPQKHEFPVEVAEVSPTFVLVYNQAIAAEAIGLDQLTGIGLRKALEFLVKDFAISLKPEAAEAIKKKRLGPCIDEYLPDPNLRECASRATWLGNDETHYVRKWTDKDISDLKVLVRLTVNWIENSLLTKKYIKEMPEDV